jgi:Flp pilus assembly protein TadG
MSFAGDARGLATLETTLMVVIVVPLLFAVIEFGWLFQRWLATESIAVHAARYAGELGGDTPALRSFIARELADVSIDPAFVRIEVAPARVGWREPIRVTVRSTERIDLPFLVSTDVPLSASAVARGEVAR